MDPTVKDTAHPPHAADGDFARTYERMARELRGRYGDGAEDLLHDALLKFLRYRDGLSHPGAELAYLRLVAQSTAQDRFRAERTRAAHLEAYRRGAAAADLGGSAGGPDARAEAVDPARLDSLAHWLRASIASLPPALREVAEAVIVNGESQRSFADRQDLPYSTVKSRVQRARQLLVTRAHACCELRFDGCNGILEVRPLCCG